MSNEERGIETLEVWKMAMQLGEIVYNIVKRWEYFDKRGLGAQWTDSTGVSGVGFWGGAEVLEHNGQIRPIP